MRSYAKPPMTPIARACRAYAEALAEFERLSARGEEKAAAETWKRVIEIREIFGQGADFARKEAAGGRR